MSKPFDADKARRMIEGGASYTHVARFFETTVTTLRCWLDPAYAMHTRERVNRNRMYSRGTPVSVEIKYRPPLAEDIAARLAEIPPDTRTLTQRVFGDPLPGRDALSKMRSIS